MPVHYDNTFLPVWVDYIEDDEEYCDKGEKLIAVWCTIIFYFHFDGFKTDGDEVVLSHN